MFPALSSLTGGGGLNSSASATAGPATQGNQGGVTIGGIQTGGSNGGVPVWLIVAALGAFLLLRKRR